MNVVNGMDRCRGWVVTLEWGEFGSWICDLGKGCRRLSIIYGGPDDEEDVISQKHPIRDGKHDLP